ncbi:hypothetical protein RJP21_02115 [Paenibacillus sp. VCA1]|uniref:hypothetical protein n=1 Tax=Paenibacillus sp. VCA1 TaxID=3039148 RepID=UPI0028712207|nr:hypothetical protein [Paenibacillus sp. VCA1]MDR9852393.1 hypothetical protein [Paenibacillus sp. VCA1]
MPFAAWIHANDLTDTQTGIIVTGFAVIVFLWIYIRTARSYRKAASARLERLRQTLDLYCRAQGLLGGDAEPAPEEAEHEPESVHFLLQQCKAAPLVTTEMIEAIDAYAKERDASRHGQLERLLDREIRKKIREQASIIRWLDNPGWGTAFWKLVRPAVPFFLLAFVVYWSVQLYGQFQERDFPLLSWTSAELWMRFVSCLAAVVSFYFAVMTPRKDSLRYAYRILALGISAAALAHLAGLWAAPYILALQVVLFACGFGVNPKRSRRDRPYAGSEDLLETDDRKPPRK